MKYRKYEVHVPADAPSGINACFIEIAINDEIDIVLGVDVEIDVWPIVGD